MSRVERVLGIGAIALLLAVGCQPVGWWDDSDYTLLNVEGDDAFVEYYASWSGWLIEPSALWKLNLATGEAQPLQDPVRQGEIRVSGDYYVTADVSDEDYIRRIVAVQISTGRRTVIAEFPEDAATYGWPNYLVANGLVAVVTTEGLVIFDLAADEIVQTIDVPAADADVEAFDGRRALVSYFVEIDNDNWKQEGYLVDVTTGEGMDLPAMPPETDAFFFNALVSEEWLALNAWKTEDSGAVRDQLLLYHIPTMTWRVLADFGSINWESYGYLETPPIQFLIGFWDQCVVVEHYRSALFNGYSRIEAIDIDNGEVRAVSTDTRGVFVLPRTPIVIEEGVLYWIDYWADVLVRHDLETGQERRFPINIP